MNDADDAGAVEALAAEMIDRFGPLPPPTANLLKLIEIKRQAVAANVAKIDVGARGALVSFHNDSFADPAGLIAYVERLKGTARLRPDNKLVIQREWKDAVARLNGLAQLTKGLSQIVARAG
jgi:transcription-repair coupling factor (superfamily II helicase)